MSKIDTVLHKRLAPPSCLRYTKVMTATKTTKSVKKTVKKAAPKKTAAKAPARVDIYPNRMTLAVASLAAVSLVLFVMIALS